MLLLLGALIVLLIVLLIIVVYISNRELFDPNDTFLPTVVGGITASKIIYQGRYGHSTNVLKLLGNTDTTIILIHNTPFDRQVWYPLFMYTQHQLRTGNKIPNLIAYDLLGHSTAWTSVPPRYNNLDVENHAWSYDEFVSDLYEIYQKYIKTGKITVVGYGVGGMIAQAFGLRYPELVDHMYGLVTTIGPRIARYGNESPYLVSWLEKNPLVTYLTMEESFLQKTLCIWFQNNNIIQCPNEYNRLDEVNVFDSVEFLIAQKLFRTASCSTYLQMNKLASSTDLREMWKSTKVPFSVTIVLGDKDHNTNIEEVSNDFKIIEHASDKASLYVVKGKHGFPLIYPEYIYELITGGDKSSDPLTVRTIKN